MKLKMNFLDSLFYTLVSHQNIIIIQNKGIALPLKFRNFAIPSQILLLLRKNSLVFLS